MPTHLRNFYFTKLVNVKEAEKEAASGNSNNTPPPKMPKFKSSPSKVKMG